MLIRGRSVPSFLAGACGLLAFNCASKGLVLISILLLYPLASRAQVDKMNHLSEVTVSAPRYATVQVMDTAVIESLSANSVADALKFFAGVQLKDYGGVGGQKTINVRSMGTQHTAIFIDGVRITNTQNGTVDLGKYSLKNFEKVEVCNGNKTSPLVSASELSSAASCYFTTKVPTADENKASYSLGSFNSHTLSLVRSRAGRYFINADGLYTDGNYKFSYHSEYEDTIGRRRNSYVEWYRVESGFFPSPKWKCHFFFYHTKRGVPGGIVKRLSDQYGDVGTEKDLNLFGQCSFSDQWRGLMYKFNFRYSYDKLRFNSDVPENCFVHCNNYYSQNDFYASAAAAYDFPSRTSLSLSSDYRFSTLALNVYGMSSICRSDFKIAASAQQKLSRLNLSLSSVFNHVADNSEMNVADPVNSLTAAFFASVNITDKLSARAFVKRSFRVPTLNDLYYTNVGSRNLVPERATQYNVGLDFKNHILHLQSDAYVNQVKDKIICIPQGGAYNWRMVNRGYVLIKGWDTSIRLSLGHFSLFSTLTLQDVRDLTDPEDYEYNHQLVYSPKCSFTNVLSFAAAGFTGSVSHMYVGRRWWSYASPDDYLSPYNCIDITAAYRLRKFKLSASVDNVLNKNYELIQRWPLPALRWKTELTYTF